MATELDDETPASAPQEEAHISRATYPLPQPLSRLLNAAVLDQQEAQVEPMEAALAQLVGNSFEAMDSMYFAT